MRKIVVLRKVIGWILITMGIIVFGALSVLYIQLASGVESWTAEKEGMFLAGIVLVFPALMIIGLALVVETGD